MAQMELVKLNNPSNVDILNLVRGNLVGTDYENRVPEATQGNLADVMAAMWDNIPRRNEFINELMNLVGLQVLRFNSYSNPFGKFKRGMLNFGDSIEEIAVGLLTAKAYNPDAEYLERILFGREPNEVQARWHKIDRQDMYKTTINQNILRRAFMNQNGVSSFVEAQMQAISTSDNWDEFVIMLNLFNTYYDEGGFYPVMVPDISGLDADSNDAKQNLKVLRAWAEKLPLKPSREYNAAHMPIVPRLEDLELFVTPNVKANLDVEGLAAMFNVEYGKVSSRMTVIPEDDVKIPNFQWALTTREFFICADTYLDMAQQPNVAGRYTNFFHHHDGIYSASPFVPALLGVATPVSPIRILDYEVTGLSDITITDLQTEDAVTNSTVVRGTGYLVSAAATTNPDGGNNAVRLSIIGNRSTKTFINNYGVLLVAVDDAAETLTIRATAVGDSSYTKDIQVSVTGSLLYGSVGQKVDDNTAVIASTTAPSINPSTGNVGSTFTVDPGKWDTRGVTLAFQWKANGTNVATNGTSSTYTAVAGDAGKTLTCVVTASKSGKTAGTATSSGATVSA